MESISLIDLGVGEEVAFLGPIPQPQIEQEEGSIIGGQEPMVFPANT